MDLTLETKEGYFNYRVAAFIIKDDKILAQRNTKTNEYYLPGGRVVFAETSEEALLREIEEELKIDITDYKPLWLNECFFVHCKSTFHEIGMYYLVDISKTDFNHFEPEFELQEESRINTYCWLYIDKLDNYLLYPKFIKGEINNINDGFKLIITRE